MYKTQLIDEVSSKCNLSKKDSEAVVNTVFKTIEDVLIAGDKIQLTGFGSFEVKRRKERVGTNPSTKERIIIPAKNAVTFKAGKSLTEKVQACMKE